MLQLHRGRLDRIRLLDRSDTPHNAGAGCRFILQPAIDGYVAHIRRCEAAGALTFLQDKVLRLHIDLPGHRQAVSAQQNHQAYLPQTETFSVPEPPADNVTVTFPGFTYKSSALAAVRLSYTLVLPFLIRRMPLFSW